MTCQVKLSSAAAELVIICSGMEIFQYAVTS